MKEELAGYYPPTDEEFKYLWANGLIILDTNSLFIFYRSKEDTRERYFRIFVKFSERLWIPHHVICEFRKDRLDVISEQKAAYQAIIGSLKSNEKKLSGNLSQFSRHSIIDVNEIEERISKTYSEIEDNLIKIEKQHPDFNLDDPILTRIMALFDGKVGPEYSSDRIKEIFIDGKIRYESKTPPGFADKDKETELGIYGDLIIWYQIIDQAKLRKKPIIFVTNDDKEDWWWKLKGKTFGPKPELVQEIRKKTGVFFYMYNSDRFLQYAQEYLHEKVDQSAVDEIRNIRTEGSIEGAKRDKDVRIEANKDVFIIGRSVTFAGFSFTGESIVRLIIFGPGKYSNGVEIATPSLTQTHSWIHTWQTGFDILPGHYTAIVYDTEKTVSDEVTVSAQKGAITIVALGNQSYYIGEEIKFSGTSTTSFNVFLSIVGPEPIREARKMDLSAISKNDDESSFVRVEVMGDNTWSYTWNTSIIATSLKAGIYTVYAIEKPITPDNIGEKVFGTVSIIIKKPFVSATASQSSYAKGDTIYVTGTAEGTQRQKIQLWLFNDSFFYHEIIRANADASFMFKLQSAVTKKMPEGQYFGIIQHPMMNDSFDIFLDIDGKNVLKKFSTKITQLFSLDGSDCLRGEKAFEELITSINSPDIDDTYTRILFNIVKPVIRFDSIGTKRIGDKFTISAQTNLAVNNEIKIAVFSSVDNSDQKNERQFCGATGVIKVLKGDSGLNKIAFDIDTSGFQPDEYTVRASAMLIDVSGEINFRIM